MAALSFCSTLIVAQMAPLVKFKYFVRIFLTPHAGNRVYFFA
jgi:hypothetical protein